MDILRIVLLIVEVLTCLLLAAVILMQQSKSQGLGLAFGGGMSDSLFGSRAGNVLTKTTIILAGVFLLNTTVLGILFSHREDASIVEAAPATAPAQTMAPAPQGPVTAPQGQPAPAPQGQGTLVIPDQPASDAGAAMPAPETMMPVTVGDAPAGEPMAVDLPAAPVATDEQPVPAPQP